MGKHFGELAKIRGLVTYRLSPHELRPMAGVISPGISNTIRRFRESMFRVYPPFIIGYIVYYLVDKAHYAKSRKNVCDFYDE